MLRDQHFSSADRAHDASVPTCSTRLNVDTTLAKYGQRATLAQSLKGNRHHDARAIAEPFPLAPGLRRRSRCPLTTRRCECGYFDAQVALTIVTEFALSIESDAPAPVAVLPGLVSPVRGDERSDMSDFALVPTT